MPETQDPNFEHFLEADLSEHEGKWVAIANGEVKFAGEDEFRVRDRASKELEGGEFVVAKVPQRDQALVV